MENKLQKQVTTKDFFQKENVKSKLNELLGQNSTALIASVLQITQSNDMLKNAEPMSVYQSACMAAILNLPLNNSLGFAYIVPFNNRKKGITEAQFQLGYKGFIQLAMRSGQVQTLSSSPIYEGQLVEENPLSGYVFDFKVKGEKVIGYASYLELLNGFKKTLYMSVEQVEKHAKKYSQTYRSGFGIWKDDFNAMALKTVTKSLLSKYAPLSVEMQKAIIADQSVVTDAEEMQVIYSDNTVEVVSVYEKEDKEAERAIALLKDCKTLDEVEKLRQTLPADRIEQFSVNFEEKINELKNEK
jgi:recombination protein RecT